LWAAHDLEELALSFIKGVMVMANQLGKRFVCEKCGTQVLCTKAGEGAVQCCDQDMKLMERKKLPSSD